MSDRKQFIIVMLVAAIFVGWLGWRGFEVINLNQALKAASACPRDREECAEYAKRAREGFEPAKRCGQMCATGARAAAEWAKTRSPKTQKVADDATGAA